jgi:hypothetical protein
MNCFALLLEGPAVENLVAKESRPKILLMVLGSSVKIRTYYLIIGYDFFHPDLSSLPSPATQTYYTFLYITRSP